MNLEWDKHVFDFWYRVRNNANIIDGKSDVRSFLRLCDRALRDTTINETNVFLEVAYILHDRINDKDVWAWLLKKANTANCRRKDTMSIAVFELIPERPVLKDDMIMLWKTLLRKDNTLWILYFAYRHNYSKLKRHYNIMQRYFKDTGQTLPPLDRSKIVIYRFQS